jgi:hypothetical protein
MFAKHGYTGQWLKVDSRQFLLPQSRNRIWFFLSLAGEGTLAESAGRIMSIFSGHRLAKHKNGAPGTRPE